MAWEATSVVARFDPGARAGVSARLRKLVLWAYADAANPDGTGAFPSVDTVAKWALCSRRQAFAAIASLLDDDLLMFEESPRPGGRGRRGRPTQYGVNLPLVRVAVDKDDEGAVPALSRRT